MMMMNQSETNKKNRQRNKYILEQTTQTKTQYDIFKYLFAMIRLDLTTMTMMLYGMMVMVMGMVLEVIVRSGNNGDDFQFSMMLIINEMKIL